MSSTPAVAEKRNPSLDVTGCTPHTHIKGMVGTDNNTRGESVLKYVVSLNLNILNQCNEHMFKILNRKEVISLRLGTNEIGKLVSKCSNGTYLMSLPRQTTSTYGFIQITLECCRSLNMGLSHNMLYGST
jgi:hypothetical protein